MIRVVIVDDHTLVRTGLKMIIDETADIEVVGEAADGAAALDLVRRTRPDVVLMDIRMPGVDGIEATRRIRSLAPTHGARPADTQTPIWNRNGLPGKPDAPRVIILTTFDLDEYVFDGLRAGASGFLLKDTLAADLLAAVREVAVGEAVAAPTVTRRLIAHFVDTTPARPGHDERLAPLTPREREVLTLIARGLANAEIAAALHLSEGTVKTHIGRILAKLNLRDRVQAVILGYETGLVDSRR